MLSYDTSIIDVAAVCLAQYDNVNNNIEQDL